MHKASSGIGRLVGGSDRTEGAVDMICRQASEPLLASPVKGRRGVLSL